MNTPPTPWTMEQLGKHWLLRDATGSYFAGIDLRPLSEAEARATAELILAAVNGRKALTIAREVEAMSAHASDELNKHLRETLEACRRYALRIADHAAGHPMDRQNAEAIVRAALQSDRQQRADSAAMGSDTGEP